MKIRLVQTIRNYDKKNLGKDLTAGLIIMAVSIPISMGYAQIAGLAGGIRTVRIGVPDSPVCVVFDVTAVHFRRGRRACRADRSGAFGSAHRERLGRRRWRQCRC